MTLLQPLQFLSISLASCARISSRETPRTLVEKTRMSSGKPSHSGGLGRGGLLTSLTSQWSVLWENPELLWNCKRHGIFWKSGSCGISSCRKLPRLGWPEADKARQAERDIYWRSTGARACKGKTREFTRGIIQYSDHLPRYVLSIVMEITWDQCLYNKMHFWHSNEVVCLTGHVVSEHDCMVKVPEVRWEFSWVLGDAVMTPSWSGMAGHPT